MLDNSYNCHPAEWPEVGQPWPLCRKQYVPHSGNSPTEQGRLWQRKWERTNPVDCNWVHKWKEYLLPSVGTPQGRLHKPRVSKAATRPWQIAATDESKTSLQESTCTGLAACTGVPPREMKLYLPAWPVEAVSVLPEFAYPNTALHAPRCSRS